MFRGAKEMAGESSPCTSNSRVFYVWCLNIGIEIPGKLYKGTSQKMNMTWTQLS